MCATEDRQKRGQECDPVTVRRTARVSILVGRERLGVFLPVCVCAMWKQALSYMVRVQTRGDKVQPKNKNWTECVIVCVRVRDTSAFSESIRPLASSANIWECDNCRECENILSVGRLWIGSRNPCGCFTNAWPFCDHGVGGDRRGKDSWRVFSWRTFKQVWVWKEVGKPQLKVNAQERWQ